MDFQRARGQPYYDTSGNTTDIEYIFDGMHVRLMHPQTGRNLHTHDIPAPVSKSEYEVACYGNLTIGDPKDNWIVEIMEQASDEDKMRLHPLTSSFRLKNEVMNCYLGSLVLHYLNGGSDKVKLFVTRTHSRKTRELGGILKTIVMQFSTTSSRRFQIT